MCLLFDTTDKDNVRDEAQDMLAEMRKGTREALIEAEDREPVTEEELTLAYETSLNPDDPHHETSL